MIVITVMNEITNLPTSYKDLILNLKSKIRSASVKAMYKVNSEMINLYFEIGKELTEKIIENQNQIQKFNIAKQASADLIKEFGKGEGFSERNINYMIKFYKNYSESPELQRLVAVVPRGSNCEILDSNLIQDQQSFYLTYTINQGCTRPVLKAQIQTDLYNRKAKELQSNFDLTIPENSEQAKQLVRDSYMLQVIDPENLIHERHLENQLIENIRDFLLELGSTYTYVGNQYKINLYYGLR
jgi:predicted nuclease of restriction endonuclease-like (RecB) superfamily